MKKLLLMLFCLRACAEDLSRDRLYRILDKVLDPNRKLVHLSEACSLRIAGKPYQVIDVQELVPGAATPRGVNRMVILDSTPRPVRIIAYTTQRPLFCVDNNLYVYGDIQINNVGQEGNVLTFGRNGQDIVLSHVEANAYPIPATRDRKTPPQ